MDFQFLCARRVGESTHSTELMVPTGGGGGNSLKLPPLSLVPPGSGLWFQQEAKARSHPVELSPVSGGKGSASCSPSPALGWFQQQTHVTTNLSNKDITKPTQNSVWFQPEPQDDSTNVNVVSTNDSAGDESDEEDEIITSHPVSSNPATPHPPQPPTPAMSPWFLSQKNKDNAKADTAPILQNGGPWFLGKHDAAAAKMHHDIAKANNEHTNTEGPWYLGQHKINTNSEHKESSKPNDDDESPWYLGQAKCAESHKQNGLWLHTTEIKVEQGTEEEKRPEEVPKSGSCVWFGYNSLLKPDSDNTRGDISKVMSWFGGGHMMRPDMVKQEDTRGTSGAPIAPGGFWFLPSSSSGNCNGAASSGTASKMLECDQCQTPFRQRDRLREHRRIHALGETPHTCTVCEKAFTTVAARECHTAVAHLNNAGHPCSCRFCDTGVSQGNHHTEHDATGMQNHDVSMQQPLRRQGGGIRRPGGPGGYECKMCGLRFPDGPALTEHVDHHPGGRPLLCRLCCKTFKSKLGLENHTRLHTGERPFECGECGARFPQRAALDYHVKGRHTGENHRTCGRCGKLFRSTPGYNNHMRLHAVRDSASLNSNSATVAVTNGGSLSSINAVIGSAVASKGYHHH